jgi:type IV pilus assembly protein PilY1
VPAAYPAQAGQIADRIFVGDAEGRLWRIDVSNPDPTKWTMQVFYDAFFDASSTTVRQPIQTAPILSVDPNGQITVAVSTGSQDNLNPNTDSNLVTNLSSVTEAVQTVAGGVKEFWSRFNWRHTFGGSPSYPQRILGPISLFDRNLYYSTYTPPSSSAAAVCSPGESRIYAEDYITPADATWLTGGKVPPIPAFNGTPPGYVSLPGVIVAGVGVRQLPSCAASTAINSDTVDDFLGFGKTTTTTTMTSGGFELVFQKSGGAGTPSQPIPTGSITITSPRVPVRIDSWAPIIE